MHIKKKVCNNVLTNIKAYDDPKIMVPVFYL